MADETLLALSKRKDGRSTSVVDSYSATTKQKQYRPDRERNAVLNTARERSMTKRPSQNETFSDSSPASPSQRPNDQSELLQFGAMLSQSIKDMTNTMVTQFEELQNSVRESRGDAFRNSFSSEEDYVSEDSDSADYELSPRKRPRPSSGTTHAHSSSGITHAHSDAVPSCSTGSKVNENKQGGTLDTVLSNIAEELHAKEKVDSSVNQQLADLVNDLIFISEKPDEEKTKQKLEKVMRPENCHSLVTTKVDELIWQRLRAHTRSFDSRMQTAQTALVKGVIVITKLLNDVLQVKQKMAGLNFESEPDLLKKQTQEGIVCDVRSCLDNVIKENFYAIDLIGLANYEFNLRRRECLKSDLNEEYFSLFSSAVPINGYLFGGDVSKRLEDIEKTNKVAQKAMGRAKGQHSSSFHHNRPTFRKKRFGFKGRNMNQPDNYRSQKPFLGKRHFRNSYRQKPEAKKNNK